MSSSVGVARYDWAGAARSREVPQELSDLEARLERLRRQLRFYFDRNPGNAPAK
jgi:hypothetical protein